MEIAIWEKTPQDLRKIVNNGINLTTYDPKNDFDKHYIHGVFSNLRLRPGDFIEPHLEGWFKTNIWSTIVDNCFIDVEDLELIRGEGCSHASGQMMNAKRKSPKERKKMGRKCDGILCERGASNEYAVIEEGKEWDVPTSLADVDELIKMIHSMLIAKLCLRRCLELTSEKKNCSNQDLKKRSRDRKEINTDDDDFFPNTQTTPCSNQVFFNSVRSDNSQNNSQKVKDLIVWENFMKQWHKSTCFILPMQTQNNNILFMEGIRNLGLGFDEYGNEDEKLN
nr:15517_t:CDS:2 [Entrophospora candida]